MLQYNFKQTLVNKIFMACNWCKAKPLPQIPVLPNLLWVPPLNEAKLTHFGSEIFVSRIHVYFYSLLHYPSHEKQEISPNPCLH